MSDEELIAYAKGMSVLYICHWEYESNHNALEPSLYFDDAQDAVCLTQQLIAEATGLVGTGDV